MAGIIVFISKEYDEFVTRIVVLQCSSTVTNACLVLTKMFCYLLSICHRKDHLFIIILTTVMLCFLNLNFRKYGRFIIIIKTSTKQKLYPFISNAE